MQATRSVPEWIALILRVIKETCLSPEAWSEYRDSMLIFTSEISDDEFEHFCMLLIRRHLRTTLVGLTLHNVLRQWTCNLHGETLLPFIYVAPAARVSAESILLSSGLGPEAEIHTLAALDLRKNTKELTRQLQLDLHGQDYEVDGLANQLAGVEISTSATAADDLVEHLRRLGMN